MDVSTLALPVLDAAFHVGSMAVNGLDSVVQLADEGEVTCEICRCEWA